MLIDIILFVIGFVFLIKGADIMVDGSSSIAKRFGVSAFFIGLTVVAFGTSAPELVVSVLASIKGSSGIALGNIVGSNISNTLLILGVSAIVAPLVVKKTTINKEIPFSLLGILAVVFLSNDIIIDKASPDSLTRIDGLILILFFIIFIVYTFGISREKENIFQKTVGELKEEPGEQTMGVAVFMVLAGLVGLGAGGHFIVNGAIGFAEYFNISQTFIALTIVAIGTSLPELAASAAAARKGKTDIAVGNVIGSNIFNLFWVLGLSAVIKPISFTSCLNIDFIILFTITVLLLLLIFIGKKNILGRGEGIALIGIYILYIVFLIFRG
ncbi:sodium:calcium antiporter [Candidatus Falkowbacteria bacterium]|nr:MAG: sodium:calcium antiporter [Candidatus Falkowbacteria bacterium]